MHGKTDFIELYLYYPLFHQQIWNMNGMEEESESESDMVARTGARTFTQFHSEFNVYQCQIIMIFHFSSNDERPFKVVQLLRLHGIAC